MEISRRNHFPGCSAYFGCCTRVCAHVYVCAHMFIHFSHVQLCVTLWTVARQPPLSMGFSRQEYWSGLPCPSPGDLPNLGIEPVSPVSPALQVDSLPLSHVGSPNHWGLKSKSRKLRDTWSNGQILPWSINCSRAKANEVFPIEQTHCS